jgi:hypothetical protein
MLLVGGVVVGGAVLVLATGSSSGLGDYLLVVAGPALLFVVVVAGARLDPDIGLRLRCTVLVLVGFESALALLQSVYRSSLVWTADYGGTEWYRAYGTEGFRSMGTMDHPLVLGLLLAMSVPLVIQMRSWVAQAAMLVLVVGAVVTTQSRTALIAVVLLVATQALRRSARRVVRVAAVVLRVAAVALVLGGFGLGVVSRFTEDSGSTDARQEAWALLPDIYERFGVLGQGHGASYLYAQQAGLTQSLESPVLTFAVDWGALFTVAYFVSVVALIVMSWRRRADTSALESAAAALVLCLSFNSLSSTSTSSVLMWAIVAVAWAEHVRAWRPIRTGLERVEAW